MIILFCRLDNLIVALILFTINIFNLIAINSLNVVNGAELPVDSLLNSKIQLYSKTPPASDFLPNYSNRVTATTSGGSNFCSAPCACLGDYIECKKQGLRQVPALPDWVQSLDLTGNKLNDNVENTIGNLQLLSSLNLKKNHLTRFPVFRGLVSLEKLNLAHNRIQAISAAALRSLPELKELELIKNRIKTIDTDCFPSPNQLSILNVNGNQIEHISVASFDSLNNLVELYLSHNNLNELPHDIFKSLSVLKKLDLSFNHLNISWGIFKGLDQLRVLKIRSNGIEYLPDGVFQALKSISIIELDSNRITNLSRNGFFTLNTLTTLSLANNTLRLLETDTWEFVQQLVSLDLSSNQLSEVSRNDFKCLSKLKKLHLQLNSIKYFDDGSLTCLANLEYLNLSGNQLSTTIEGTPGSFSSLKKLETLELKDNDIKSINKKAFLGLENVQYLNLNGNNITTIQVNAFEPLKHLDRIVLNSTHFLCDCNLQWLYSWLSLHVSKHREYDEEHQLLVCDYPPEIRGKRLLSLREKEDFLCNESPKPKLINELKNQLAIKGTNVTLECTAISSVAEPMAFQWRRDNIDIKPNETETVHQDLNNNNTMMSSRLRLYNVNREHNGKYQCVVTNSFGSAYSQRFKITVASYPGFRRKPTNVTLSAGSTARLDCSAYGEPMPQIAWQKDGGNEFPAARERRMHVMPTDDAFFIINAKPSDMGVYTCTAENPAGTIKANATLTVHETPGFLKSAEVREEILVGKSFVLDCFIRGSPRPNLNWYKDDQRLKATDRLYFAAENQLMIVTDSAYTDAGVYKCEIKNDLGSAYRYMTIKVSKTISKAIVNGDEMTGIIIITILCCTIVTSFICGVIIYQTKKGNECNNNSFVGNATPRSMNLQSRFLFHQQQHTNQTDDGDISAGNLYPSANGNLPSSHDNADCTSNKDSGTGDSSKRSRSVDDINVNDTYSNCSNNPTAADSIELATYSANTTAGGDGMIPLLKSSRNHHSPDKLPPPSSSNSNHQRQSLSILSINNNNSNSNNTLANNNSSPTSLHSSSNSSSKSNKNLNNYLSNCNGGPSSFPTTEQRLPLIQNNDTSSSNNKTSSNRSGRNNYSYDTNGSLANHSSSSFTNSNSMSI